MQPQDWYSYEKIKTYGLLAKRVIPLLEKLEFALKIHPRLLRASPSSPIPTCVTVKRNMVARWAAGSQTGGCGSWESRQGFMNADKILCSIRLWWTSSGELNAKKINYGTFKKFQAFVGYRDAYCSCGGSDCEIDVHLYIPTCPFRKSTEEEEDAPPHFAPYDYVMASVMAVQMPGGSLNPPLFGGWEEHLDLQHKWSHAQMEEEV
jgi:hypothetical protein